MRQTGAIASASSGYYGTGSQAYHHSADCGTDYYGTSSQTHNHSTNCGTGNDKDSQGFNHVREGGRRCSRIGRDNGRD
ncbi:MAG: hypothetical protein HYX79_10905 [Chloroflexi bacterium]|nr:hypothetical protein [Chloroflexota bacterium]